MLRFIDCFMRYRKALKSEVAQILTEVEEARIAVTEAEQSYFAAGANVRDAFKRYVAECLPHIARIPNIRGYFTQPEASEVMGALERLVGIVSQYMPLVEATEPHVSTQAAAADIREQRDERLVSLAGAPPSLTSGQKAAYTRMSPAQKAAYTKRMKKENARATSASSEVVSYDGKKAQALREKLGYSRTKLASELKLSPSYITAIESGQSRISENPRGTKMKRYFQWYQKNIGA